MSQAAYTLSVQKKFLDRTSACDPMSNCVKLCQTGDDAIRSEFLAKFSLKFHKSEPAQTNDVYKVGSKMRCSMRTVVVNMCQPIPT